MTGFQAKRLPAERDLVATDGCDVRVLLGLAGGTMAHFQLEPGHTSTAVAHRTVEEIWFFLSGRGEMWLEQEGREEIVPIESGVCLTIPLGTQFQCRSLGDEALAALSITMPPWPGEGEAVVVRGKWEPTVPSDLSLARMTTEASGFTRVEGCDLCRAARMTPWYHEDEVCWIAECDVCDVPMVVWRWHGTAPPPEHVEHMHARLREVATAEVGEYYVDDHMRNIPDHWHAHARPKGGFFGARRPHT